MYINIFYPKDISHLRVKYKSRLFFSKTDYVHRNGVYSHKEQGSIFALTKGSTHICVEYSTVEIFTFINSFLQSVFGDSLIGIEFSENICPIAIHSLNYILL